MAYAIMQTELLPPEIEQLTAAFRALPILTAIDAQTVARDAFGILLRGLDVEQASTLQDALGKHGVQTEVVEENGLPAIPPAKVVRQVEILPNHLSMYDPMGRAFTLPWRDIMIIAAGNVRLPESKRQKNHDEAHLRGGHSLDPDHKNRDSALFHLMLEIVTTNGQGRYSILADEFDFSHLGINQSADLTGNFVLLLRELAENAPHAGLNRGAFLITQGNKEVFVYPSKAAFNEELTWFLWRTAQPAPGV